MSNKIKPDNSFSLLVVIVNYRTPDLTIDCLRSLVDEIQLLPGTSVVVTDNASGDGSAERIQTAIDTQGWSEWVFLMPLEKNGGFAYGNNEAIRPALESDNPPAYVVLLNPDTIVLPGALKELWDFMEQHPEAGIAGSRLESPDGSPQRSAFRFPTILSELDSGLRLGLVSQLLSKWIVAPPVPEAVCQTDWVAGASMIVRREVFERVGVMDESYFLYYEEVDFCLQANKAGWSCWYVPQSKVIHLVGQSSGIDSSKQLKKRLPKYCFESRQRYFIKNYGWFYVIATDLVWAFCYILWQIRRVIQNKPHSDPPQLFADFVRNSSFSNLSKPNP